VSRAFVNRVLGGGNAVGRRIRHVAAGDERRPDAERWYEIVGVVEDLQANRFEPELAPALVFYPVSPAQVQGGSVLVRLRGDDAERFAPLLREAITALDPALKVGLVRPMASAERTNRVTLLVGAVLVLVLLAVLLLSAAGIHALMSFTVTQRRKEIGIRTALGADPRRLLGSIFSRAMGQLALGAAVGVALGGALLLRSGSTPGWAAVLLLTVAALILAAGLLATLGPARRGLRLQPMDALRAD
jgi:hypothetical protein